VWWALAHTTESSSPRLDETIRKTGLTALGLGWILVRSDGARKPIALPRAMTVTSTNLLR
jgi:hypothetical protein